MNLTELTSDDIHELVRDCYAELDRRTLIANAKAQIERIRAEYAEAIAAEPPVPADAPDFEVGPEQLVVDEPQLFKNVSNDWVSARPSEAPELYEEV